MKHLHEHFCYLDEQINALDKEMDGQLPLGSAQPPEPPCVEPITASPLCAELGDGKQLAVVISRRRASHSEFEAEPGAAVA